MAMILVYGGAFNPPTKAHKTIMIYLIDLYKPNKFIFLPVGDIYPKKGLIAYKHRENMLKCFCSDEIIVSNFEQQKAFKGTISALDYFKELYQDDVTFILGADNLKDMPRWLEADRLMKDNKFLIIDRDKKARQHLARLDKHRQNFTIIDMDLEENASSYRLDPTKFASYLDECVMKYIKKERLYEVPTDV